MSVPAESEDRIPEPPLTIPANVSASPAGAAPGSPLAPPIGGSIAGSVLPIRRAEELIATLPGVLSVRIVPGESGAIDEVHVLTTDAVAPKATVRNIESALMAQLGLRVNHRKVSVATTLDPPRALDQPVGAGATAGLGDAGVPGAELSGRGSASAYAPELGASAATVASAGSAGAAAAGVRAGAARTAAGRMPLADSAPVVGRTRGAAAEGRRVLLFEDVEVRRSRTRGVLCRVTLSREGSHFVGEAEGQESERSRIELAARATIHAILQALASSTPSGERSLALEGAKLLDAFDREFVFVSVAARFGRELVVLAGTCEVRESAETSAVLAVLDATNRWVHLES